jgi:alpha-tubulin suppressor-like RCC1 family protein
MNSISSKYVMGPQSNFSFGTFTLADTIGSKVLDVSAGEGHTCAILTNHALKCWGDNENGELGLGDNLRRYVPAVSTVNLGNDRLAIEVVATYGITCVLLDNATTKCWGNNDVSQLGDNSNIDLNVPPSSPINFGPGELVSTISVNRTHGCASLMTGVVR